MMNARLGWLPQSHSHIQCTDRQIPFHATTGGPADDAPRIQIKDDGQIKPTFTGSNIGCVARPFLIWCICREILIQQIRCNTKSVITIGCDLVFAGSNDLITIFPHQTTDTTVPNPQPQFLQLLGHPGPPVALQAKAMLFSDMGSNHHVFALTLTHWADPPYTKAPRCDLHDTAQKLDRPNSFPGFDESKPHRLWPAKKIAAFFSTSSPLAANGLLCEGGYFPIQHPHTAQTLSFRTDAFEPTCSASKAQPPNLMRPSAALAHSLSQCAPHHVETRLCI